LPQISRVTLRKGICADSLEKTLAVPLAALSRYVRLEVSFMPDLLGDFG